MGSHKHIEISNPVLCSGCSACAQTCPKGCITMQEDKMGSKYPIVNTIKCIRCGACVKVCPFLNPADNTFPIKCYAAINKNENVRLNSSSGGIFKSLASHMISHGGIVVGTIFNKDWMVEHFSAENMDKVELMMGSKYVQSDTALTYSETHKHLLAGHHVLYSGTPCQIAGLNHFLRKEYSNLITVEIICHGAPERGVWRSYFKEISEQKTNGIKYSDPELHSQVIDGISFRDKRKGWKNFGFSISRTFNGVNENKDVLPSNTSSIYESHQNNAYMKAFLMNLSLRPSCYACQAKSGKSHADLTIGDFWGIGETDIMPDDDKGVSAIVCRSNKGDRFLQQCNDVELVTCSYQDILRSNISLEQSIQYTNNARRFHKKFLAKGFMKALYDIEHPSLFNRAKASLEYRFSIAMKYLKKI